MIIYQAPNNTLYSTERNFLLTQAFNLQVYNDTPSPGGNINSTGGQFRLSANKVLNSTIKLLSKG